MININIVKDYTDAPGARYIDDGEFSWEQFYENILKNKYQEAIDTKQKLYIDLDWTYWYPSSFLSEAFWRLYINFWKEKDIWETLELKSDEDASLIDFIKELLKDYE